MLLNTVVLIPLNIIWSSLLQSDLYQYLGLNYTLILTSNQIKKT